MWKAPILSFLSHSSTPSRPPPTEEAKLLPQRLYLFTGKGGVGKTSLAMAFTKFLQGQGKKVYYQSLDQALNQDLLEKLEVPHFNISPQQSMEKYISHKLNSPTIARWILKTPFFSKLIHILPSFSQFICLGYILSNLKKDPSLTIVLDGQSSGHIISLFEAGQNFKKIFKIGIIVQDIEQIYQFLHDKNKLKILVLALPSAMAIQEGEELSLQFSQYGLPTPTLVLNRILTKSPSLLHADPSTLPEFLAKKILLENQAIHQLKLQQNSVLLPYSHHSNQSLVVQDLIPHLQGLV